MRRVIPVRYHQIKMQLVATISLLLVLLRPVTAPYGYPDKECPYVEPPVVTEPYELKVLFVHDGILQDIPPMILMVEPCPLARGCYGVVYGAVEVRSSRRLAIKTATDNQTMELLRKELKLYLHLGAVVTLASVNDTKRLPAREVGLPRIYAYGVPETLPAHWVLCELMIMERMATQLEYSGAPQTQTAINLYRVSLVMKTLAYIHAQNVLHGDIKPENIMLDDEGSACLVDFGMGSHIKSDSPPITLIGTVQYFSVNLLLCFRNIIHSSNLPIRPRMADDLVALAKTFMKVEFGSTPCMKESETFKTGVSYSEKSWSTEKQVEFEILLELERALPLGLEEVFGRVNYASLGKLLTDMFNVALRTDNQLSEPYCEVYEGKSLAEIELDLLHRWSAEAEKASNDELDWNLIYDHFKPAPRIGVGFEHYGNPDLNPDTTSVNNNLMVYYVIVRTLGRGNGGEVFMACEVRTGRVVAVKLALRESAAELFNEWEIYKHLGAIVNFGSSEDSTSYWIRSVGIPRVYGYGTVIKSDWRGYKIIIMEKHGNSLESLKDVGLPIKDLIGYTYEMMKIVEFLHSKNVRHGDIKPGNFLLGENGKLFVVDFGLSSIVTNTNIIPRNPGTLYFASLNALLFYKYLDQNLPNIYHMGEEDDLESLAKSFLYMVFGVMPYDNVLASFLGVNSRKALNCAYVNVPKWKPEVKAMYNRMLEMLRELPNMLTTEFEKVGFKSLGELLTEMIGIARYKIPEQVPNQAVSESISHGLQTVETEFVTSWGKEFIKAVEGQPDGENWKTRIGNAFRPVDVNG